MLVQLAPWQSTDTSMPFFTTASPPKNVSASKSNSEKARRRKRSMSDAATSATVVGVCANFVAASPTNSKRSNKQTKKRKKSQQSQSSESTSTSTARIRLTLASSHAMQCLVQTQQTQPWQEADQLGHHARPGASSAFWDPSSLSSSSNKPISPVLSEPQGRVWALQHFGQHVVSWNLPAAGKTQPEETTTCTTLRGPAASLHLLPSMAGSASANGVYGTLLDGTLFSVTSSSLDDAPPHVSYFHPTGETTNDSVSAVWDPKDEHHLHTSCTIESSPQQHQQQSYNHQTKQHPKSASGTKRKQTSLSSDMDASSSVYHMVQVSFHGPSNSLNIRQHDIHTPLSSSSLSEHSSNNGMTNTSIPLTHVPNKESIRIEQLNETTLVVAYSTMALTTGKPIWYCAPIQLGCVVVGGGNSPQARLQRNPFALLDHVQEFSGLTSTLVAVGTHDTLAFYDVHYGSVVYSTPLDDMLFTDTANHKSPSSSAGMNVPKRWSLVTDPSVGSIAILTPSHSNHVNTTTRVHWSHVSLDGTTTVSLPYTLAVALASSSTMMMMMQQPNQDGKNNQEESGIMLSPSSLQPKDRDLLSLFQTQPPLANKKSNKTEVALTMNNKKKQPDAAVAVLSHEMVEQTVEKCLERLSKCIQQIMDPKSTDKKGPSFLLEYYATLASLLDTMEGHQRSTTTDTSLRNNKANGSGSISSSNEYDNPQDATPSALLQKRKNGMMNGTTHHGADSKKAIIMMNGDGAGGKPHRTWVSRVKTSTPSHTPQRFIDGTLSIALGLLLVPKQELTPTQKQRMHFAKFDARVVLGYLLRTDRVMIRQHLNEDEAATKSLPLLLKVMHSKRGGTPTTNALSPVDLMETLLTHCSDLSERMLVELVRFVLCRAEAQDIATHFVKSCKWARGDGPQTLAKEYFAARQELRTLGNQLAEANRAKKVATKELLKLPDKKCHAKSIEKEVAVIKGLKVKQQECGERVERVSQHLIKEGTLQFLQSIVMYSKCNDSLLRNIIRKELTDLEAEALLSALSKLLQRTGGEILRSPLTTRRLTASLVQWTTALLDAHSSNLLETNVDDESSKLQSAVKQLQEVVQAAVAQADTLIALQSTMELLVSSSRSNDNNKVVPTLAVIDAKNRGGGPIPPYSMERLAF